MAHFELVIRIQLFFLNFKGFNRSFPCPSEAALVLISVTMVPHLASCVKGAFLLSLSAIYVALPWAHHHPTMQIPCWSYRYRYYDICFVSLGSYIY